MASSPKAMDTIAAIATPAGRGGVGIVRVSGPLSTQIATAILGKLPQPRVAEYLPFKNSDHQIIDIGLALFFASPKSFTGEDVLELHGHGGSIVMDMLLQEVLSQGARIARPGEFSERAFLNGKLDLTQAEAIADLIDSASTQAARFAIRSLQGEFSKQIHSLVALLIDLRTYVESAIDFPEEEIDFLKDSQVASQLITLKEQLSHILSIARQGQLMREGMSIVIAGRPNAGKSTLLNRLTGSETAIVTEIPGTTRDVIKVHINLDGMPLHIIDTAGLREGADIVEQEGIRRAWNEIKQADRILYLVDAQEYQAVTHDPLFEQLQLAGPGITIVYNKMDLVKDEFPQAHDHIDKLAISAKTGEGVEELRAHLKSCAGFQNVEDGGFMARRRHLQALQQALEHVQQGEQQLLENQAGELLAEELRQAQQQLAQITGEFSADDLLGKIFSSFCIGK
ncbi:tRNA uridine-5-carboxymethylaminomethyl(34) synthesis GTPase MnmE [Kaarinaea lacus]